MSAMFEKFMNEKPIVTYSCGENKQANTDKPSVHLTIIQTKQEQR
jgi:hypothetical protein